MGGGRGKVRLMFQDEAGFGRISKPASCWVTGKMRPVIASQHVREFRYAFGAVDPKDGESFFIVAPKCNTAWTNAFLVELSKAYPDYTEVETMPKLLKKYKNYQLYRRQLSA